MCIIDGKIDCIIDPIKNAIYSVIYPFFAWLIEAIVGVFTFIYNIGLLLYTVTGLLTNVFADMFAVNPYAASALGLITGMMSLQILLRIYNLLAGTTIWGFKLPRL